MALAFAILGDILPPRERGRYIGYFTLAFVGAALLGPLIGGFIIDQWTWPWIFFINIPLAGFATVVSYHALRLPFPRRKARLDLLGALLLSLTIGTLMIGLEEGGGGDGWTQPHVVALFAVAAVALAVFIAVKRPRRGADDPAPPVRRPSRTRLRRGRHVRRHPSPSAPASSSLCTSRTRCSCHPPSPACGCCRRCSASPWARSASAG